MSTPPFSFSSALAGCRCLLRARRLTTRRHFREERFLHQRFLRARRLRLNLFRRLRRNNHFRRLRSFCRVRQHRSRRAQSVALQPHNRIFLRHASTGQLIQRNIRVPVVRQHPRPILDRARCKAERLNAVEIGRASDRIQLVAAHCVLLCACCSLCPYNSIERRIVNKKMSKRSCSFSNTQCYLKATLQSRNVRVRIRPANGV